MVIGIDSTDNYVPPPAKLRYYVKKLDPLATPTPPTIPTTLSICVKIQRTTSLFVVRGLIANELGFMKGALEGSVGTQVKGEDEGKSLPQPERQTDPQVSHCPAPAGSWPEGESAMFERLYQPLSIVD